MIVHATSGLSGAFFLQLFAAGNVNVLYYQHMGDSSHCCSFATQTLGCLPAGAMRERR